MDLRQKVSRLVSSSISLREGDDHSEQFRRLRDEVVELGIGGYTIFGGNVDSVAEMNRELSEAASHPLLVSSDLERGLGQQLEGGTVLPSQMAVGATGIPDLAFAQGWVTAVEARAVGINLIFSPVADVMSEPENPIIGIRSFGGDAETVASFTTSFIRGCRLGGAAATAKHFPGHGDTSLDSHIELPVVRAGAAILENRELVPFRAAVDEGVPAVMTAHVAYPELTGDETPATLSPGIVDGILRDGLGYEGLVVTDALLMGGITETWTCDEAAIRAVEAGADVLLMPDDTAGAISAVVRAVESGRIAEGRIDRSVARIDALLSWVASRPAPGEPGGEVDEGVAAELRESAVLESRTRAWQNPRHDEAAIGIARRAITLLRDDDGHVACDASHYSAERAGFYAVVEAERPANLLYLRSELAESLTGATISVADAETPAGDVDAMVENVACKECCVISIFDDIAAWRGRAGPAARSVEILRRLIQACPKPIVFAFTGPQLSSLVPEARSLLCCYDGSPAMQVAAVEALLGKVPIRGHLPVAVPGLYDIGHGLERG